MAVPDINTLLRPLLGFAGDGEEHATRDAVECLSHGFGLSPDERDQLIPSGYRTVMLNNVAWARAHLNKAGLIENTQKGMFKITAQGKSLLEEGPNPLDIRTLNARLPEQAERESNEETNLRDATTPDTCPPVAPEDAIVKALELINERLINDVLDRVRSVPPAFFEQLVLDLLIKMGYGGSRREAASRLGRTGDGGIDGTIIEDRLGLDTIYVQAKRWQGTVGRPEIQKFAGALVGRHANKGVFITTSIFSAEARAFAETFSTRIVLIDGVTLSRLMVEYGLGVSTVATYDIKRLDRDYFDKE